MEMRARVLRVLRVMGFIGLAAGVTACSQALKFSTDDSAKVLSQQTITAPNPANRGSYTVNTLFYGSGTDQRRLEYRDRVRIKTNFHIDHT